MTSIPRVWKRTDSKIYWITLPSGERISLKTRLRSDANKIALQITKILSTPKELVVPQFATWARTLPHSLQERLIALSVLPQDILDSRLIQDHLASWKASLDDSGATSSHTSECLRVVNQVCQKAKIQLVEELRIRSIEEALCSLAAAGDWSSRTFNKYRGYLIQFEGWLHDRDLCQTKCLQKIKRRKEESSGVGAIDPEALQTLLAWCESAKTRSGRSGSWSLSGSARSLLYRTAVETGLRESEIVALQWRDIHTESASITLRPETTKNNLPRTLPISDSLLKALEVHRDLACPESNQEPVFRLPTYTRALWKYLLRKDLEDAGLSLTNSNGDKLGWKSFRKFYATELSRRGLSVPSIQRAIGHASARTTERYLDPSRDLDRRACFSVLPRPQNRAPNRALFSDSNPNHPKKKALQRQEGFQKRGGRDSNSQPPDRQSGALTN